MLSTCYQPISPWYAPLDFVSKKHFKFCYIFVIRQRVKYFSFQATFIFSLINACPSLCWFRSGHNLVKNKSCLKWKKNYIGFLIIKIWQILKRFCRTKTLISDEYVHTYIHAAWNLGVLAMYYYPKNWFFWVYYPSSFCH